MTAWVTQINRLWWTLNTPRLSKCLKIQREKLIPAIMKLALNGNKWNTICVIVSLLFNVLILSQSYKKVKINQAIHRCQKKASMLHEWASKFATKSYAASWNMKILDWQPAQKLNRFNSEFFQRNMSQILEYARRWKHSLDENNNAQPKNTYTLERIPREINICKSLELNSLLSANANDRQPPSLNFHWK